MWVALGVSIASTLVTALLDGTQGQTVNIIKTATTLNGSNGGSLTLTPTDAALAAKVASIVLRGRADELRCIDEKGKEVKPGTAGEIAAKGAIHVEGSLNGQIQVDELTIGSRGQVEGVVTCQSLHIKGKFTAPLRFTSNNKRCRSFL